VLSTPWFSPYVLLRGSRRSPPTFLDARQAEGRFGLISTAVAAVAGSGVGDIGIINRLGQTALVDDGAAALAGHSEPGCRNAARAWVALRTDRPTGPRSGS
jgi:hypothetical protein